MTAAGMEEDPFAALLHAAGIQRAYHDGLGVHRVASDEACIATLRGLGIPLERREDATQIGAELARKRASQPIAPVVAGWEGQPVQLIVSCAHGEGHLHLEGNGQPSRTLQLTDETAPPIEDLGDGRLRRQADLGVLPPGRYRLCLERPFQEPALSRLLVAPSRAYHREHRRFGLFLPLYSAWSDERPFADYRHLHDLRGWASSEGAAFFGTLPLFPTFLEEPFDPSPYSPISRRFFSELYLDPTRLFEVTDGTPPASGSDGLLDYRAWWAMRRPILEEGAKRFFTRGAPGLEVFLQEVPDALDYARFRAAFARDGRWPNVDHFNPERPLETSDKADTELRLHLYAQLQIRKQFREADPGVAGLYLDFPLGVHAKGYDAWRHRDRFATGLGVGAPPDPLFSYGQSWGFAPLHPERLLDDHVDYLDGCLARVMAHADVLRVDHVMGLHRVFCIPEGFAATDGLYVTQPKDVLYALFNLNSHEHQTELVGEDLGTVPDEVRWTIAERGWRRMFVLPFHVRHDHIEAPPNDSLACLNTHDLPPFAGYLDGLDLELLTRLGFALPGGADNAHHQRHRDVETLCRVLGVEKQPDALLEAAIRFVAGSDAALVLISLEDLWLERHSQNVPGTATEHPNWRGRCRHGVHEIANLDRVSRVLAALRELRPAVQSDYT